MKFNLFNCKAFRKKKHVVQGGAILDQVISESCSPNNKVLLYKLANYKLGLCLDYVIGSLSFPPSATDRVEREWHKRIMKI